MNLSFTSVENSTPPPSKQEYRLSSVLLCCPTRGEHDSQEERHAIHSNDATKRSSLPQDSFSTVFNACTENTARSALFARAVALINMYKLHLHPRNSRFSDANKTNQAIVGLMDISKCEGPLGKMALSDINRLLPALTPNQEDAKILLYILEEVFYSLLNSVHQREPPEETLFLDFQIIRNVLLRILVFRDGVHLEKYPAASNKLASYYKCLNQMSFRPESNPLLQLGYEMLLQTESTFFGAHRTPGMYSLSSNKLLKIIRQLWGEVQDTLDEERFKGRLKQICRQLERETWINKYLSLHYLAELSKQNLHCLFTFLLLCTRLQLETVSQPQTPGPEIENTALIAENRRASVENTIWETERSCLLAVFSLECILSIVLHTPYALIREHALAGFSTLPVLSRGDIRYEPAKPFTIPHKLDNLPTPDVDSSSFRLAGLFHFAWIDVWPWQIRYILLFSMRLLSQYSLMAGSPNSTQLDGIQQVAHQMKSVLETNETDSRVLTTSLLSCELIRSSEMPTLCSQRGLDGALRLPFGVKFGELSVEGLYVADRAGNQWPNKWLVNEIEFGMTKEQLKEDKRTNQSLKDTPSQTGFTDCGYQELKTVQFRERKISPPNKPGRAVSTKMLPPKQTESRRLQSQLETRGLPDEPRDQKKSSLQTTCTSDPVLRKEPPDFSVNVIHPKLFVLETQ